MFPLSSRAVSTLLSAQGCLLEIQDSFSSRCEGTYHGHFAQTQKRSQSA